MQAENNTKDLLLAVSSRLSSREECRKRSYTLKISGTGRIQFDPYIEVYPNRYHRNQSDKISVIEYILKQDTFSHLHPTFDSGVAVEATTVVPGTYIYELSVSGAKRRWTKEGV